MKVWLLHDLELLTGPITVANTFGCDELERLKVT